jgi:hypothetical protein
MCEILRVIKRQCFNTSLRRSVHAAMPFREVTLLKDLFILILIGASSTPTRLQTSSSMSVTTTCSAIQNPVALVRGEACFVSLPDPLNKNWNDWDPIRIVDHILVFCKLAGDFHLLRLLRIREGTIGTHIPWGWESAVRQPRWPRMMEMMCMRSLLQNSW